jgi:hypothetical protein
VRAVVQSLLDDPSMGQWSHRKIAEVSQVSRTFVRTVASEIGR